MPASTWRSTGRARLVFALRVEQYSQEIDQVVVEIVPLETGCELTLTHGMSPDWAEHQGRIEAGWGMVLDALWSRRLE